MIMRITSNPKNNVTIPNVFCLYLLSDFIRLNACGLQSAGLAMGKAGVAIALFEAARTLQDEAMEDDEPTTCCVKRYCPDIRTSTCKTAGRASDSPCGI